MKNLFVVAASMLIVVALCAHRATAQNAHGAGPTGGVVFDLGSHHAEFTVNHEKGEVTIVVLGADEKSTTPVTASELILVTKETKTADGKAVPSMTIVLLPQDDAGGKSATFVGSDPGIGNVADFAGTVSAEIDGKPATGEFDEATGGHAHSAHDGVVAALKNEADQIVGFVELKLHDDKGDLEAWLGKDRMIKEPIDLPAGTTLVANFNDLPGKTAALRIRNNRENEDEDGNPNLRNGLTNYFIFPGDSGQDPSWLMGKDFKSVVVLSFTVDGKAYTSEEFTLVPHTHADGHGHTH
jgi:hypothetical protein